MNTKIMILVGLLIILYLIHKKQSILRSKEKFQQKCNLLSESMNICQDVKIKTLSGSELMITDKKLNEDYIPGMGSGKSYTLMTKMNSDGSRTMNITDMETKLNLATTSTENETGKLIFTNRSINTNMFRYTPGDAVSFLIHDIYNNYIKVENSQVILTKNVDDSTLFYIA
jgi:hypothetical protein